MAAMDDNRFDALSRLLGRGVNRRSAVAALAALVAGGGAEAAAKGHQKDKQTRHKRQHHKHAHHQQQPKAAKCVKVGDPCVTTADCCGAKGGRVQVICTNGKCLNNNPGNPPGSACSSDADCGANQVCVQGQCQSAAACPTGQVRCGTGKTCVDLQTDPANCGSCGHACGANETCGPNGCCVAQLQPCASANQCCATDHTACSPNNVVIGQAVCCSTLGGTCTNGGPSGDCCAVNVPEGQDYAYCSPKGACGGTGATCRFNEACVSGQCCKAHPTDDSGTCSGPDGCCKAQLQACTSAAQCCSTDHTACAPNNVVIGQDVCCSTLGGACTNGGPSGDCCAVTVPEGQDYAYCSPSGACGGEGAVCRFNEACVSGQCCKAHPTDDSGVCSGPNGCCVGHLQPCTAATQCCATDHTACAPNNVVIGQNVCCSTLGGTCTNGGPSGDCCAVTVPEGQDYAYCSANGACGGTGATCRFNEACVSGQCTGGVCA